MADDYGFYGREIDGYVHYNQAFNESQKSGAGGPNPSSSSGCLTSIGITMAAIFGSLIFTSWLSNSFKSQYVSNKSNVWSMHLQS